jgi:Uncharacterized conserved protein (DUF2285)
VEFQLGVTDEDPRRDFGPPFSASFVPLDAQGFGYFHASKENVMVTRPRPQAEPDIAEEAPISTELTDYDYKLLSCYLRMLDAEKEGADWREVAQIVLGVDPDSDYDRAKRMYESHLARAHWMTQRGHALLLREAYLEW